MTSTRERAYVPEARMGILREGSICVLVLCNPGFQWEHVLTTQSLSCFLIIPPQWVFGFIVWVHLMDTTSENHIRSYKNVLDFSVSAAPPQGFPLMVLLCHHTLEAWGKQTDAINKYSLSTANTWKSFLVDKYIQDISPLKQHNKISLGNSYFFYTGKWSFH